MGAFRIDGGQRVEKELAHRLSHEFAFRALEQFLRGGIRQRDVAVEPGGDQAAADGLNNIFVQRLQVFQRPAGVLQLYVDLAQLRRQQARPDRPPPGSRTD